MVERQYEGLVLISGRALPSHDPHAPTRAQCFGLVVRVLLRTRLFFLAKILAWSK